MYIVNTRIILRFTSQEYYRAKKRKQWVLSRSTQWRIQVPLSQCSFLKLHHVITCISNDNVFEKVRVRHFQVYVANKEDTYTICEYIRKQNFTFLTVLSLLLQHDVTKLLRQSSEFFVLFVISSGFRQRAAVASVIDVFLERWPCSKP